MIISAQTLVFITKALIIISALAAIGVMFYTVKHWFIPFFKNRKDQRIVIKTSSKLKQLKELNSKYTNFDTDLPQTHTFTTYLNTKAKFDRYDLNKMFEEKITDGFLVALTKKFERNWQIYLDYREKVKIIESLDTKQDAQNLRISYDRYKEVEDRLFIKYQLHPRIDCEIICRAEYSSPQGRNQYKKEQSFSLFQVQTRCLVLQQKKKSLSVEDMRRRRERSRMTDKLRQKILERDGYKCCLCGYSKKDGVKLHVDHIIPVSKGGTTVESNLRTLCDACNWGKGTKIELTYRRLIKKNTIYTQNQNNKLAYSLSQNQPRLLSPQQKIKLQYSEVWRRKREQSQMNDKLRYKILERDGFKCCLCGRSAKDGVKLHVDHVIPLIKGGKTVENNLRTVCNLCS